MIITGIGSRDIDTIAYSKILRIARRLASLGWRLRSGGATGADDAWEKGWEGYDTKEIFLPKGTFNGRRENGACYIAPSYDDMWLDAEDIARGIHPRFDLLDPDFQLLHTRNVYQVLGRDLNTKSDVVAAWAPPNGNSVKGGTATAFNLARAKGIPTYNLWLEGQRQEFFSFIFERMGITDVHTPAIKHPPSQNILSNFFDFESS